MVVNQRCAPGEGSLCSAEVYLQLPVISPLLSTK